MKLVTHWLVRLLLGGFFLAAGGLKLVEPAKFAADIANYRLVPHAAVNLLAITLPGIEVVAGALLLAGRWRRASAVVITGLMAVFVVAVAAALARGLDVRCGCFGTIGATRVGWAKLTENVALLALAAWLWWRTED
jgi:uncharacterized membrane protein YphA (DoxX/SURF4 family)